jgi:ribosomal protein S17E
MSLLENFAENFGATFQDNHFQVNRVYTTWSLAGNNRIVARQKGRKERNCVDERNWMLFVLDLKLH